MFEPKNIEHIFLYRGFVDFRKSIDGLSEIVSQEMDLDLFAPSVFVFVSRRRNRVKILYWDLTGYALWYKRLEKDRFCWLKKGMRDDVISIEVSQREFQMFLHGYDIFRMKPHESLQFEKVS
jgi:hypothetical protein